MSIWKKSGARTAERKVVVRKSDGRFASETVDKIVGDKHGTSTENGYVDGRKTTNQGELMSHSRAIYIHKCEMCPVEFEGVATAKYCSNACRQKAKRAKAAKKREGL